MSLGCFCWELGSRRTRKPNDPPRASSRRPAPTRVARCGPVAIAPNGPRRQRIGWMLRERPPGRAGHEDQRKHRAISRPLTPAKSGLSQSLADSPSRRSGRITGPDGTASQAESAGSIPVTRSTVKPRSGHADGILADTRVTPAATSTTARCPCSAKLNSHNMSRVSRIKRSPRQASSRTAHRCGPV